MTLAELYKNEEFRKQLEQQLRAGVDSDDKAVEIIIATAAEHGVETNANEVRAYLVQAMPLSDDEMDKVAGGDPINSDYCFISDRCLSTIGGACVVALSCYTAMIHTDSTAGCVTNHACWSDYQCVAVYNHSRCAVLYNCSLNEDTVAY